MSAFLPFLRGLVERIIDNQLTDENLAITHQLFERWKPAVKNREDAVFGYIIGYVNASVSSLFQHLGRVPTQEEFSEMGNSVRNNIRRIRSRINETMT